MDLQFLWFYELFGLLVVLLVVWIFLMPRIAEKLEFIKGRAVKVYAKAGIGRKAGHKKTRFRANFQ